MPEKDKAKFNEKHASLVIACQYTAEFIAENFAFSLNKMPYGCSRPGKYTHSLVDKDICVIFYDERRQVATVIKDKDSVHIIDDHAIGVVGITNISAEYEKLCNRLDILLEK